jgi:hypothetical protein
MEKNQSNSKENEIRKAVIRTQRWRLRNKLQRNNNDEQPTVPEESHNSRSKYDSEMKEQQSILQLVSSAKQIMEV